MSRSGYIDDCESWDLIRWRGAVKSALRGKRGQAFLKELLAALDALPEKKLVDSELESHGSYCTLGAVGRARGINMEVVDPEDNETVAKVFNIPFSLACEIMFENDEAVWKETPEHRWQRMRDWTVRNIIEEGKS